MNQCPTKDKGKAEEVNTVIVEVQQAITQSKAKQSEWDIHEAVTEMVSKEWVDEANNNSVARISHPTSWKVNKKK